jgi:hypothetical protein
MVFFWFRIHTASAPGTAGTSTDGGAVIGKPGSVWLEGTPAMDHGMNGKRIHMKSNKRKLEHNTHKEARNMDEEHNR